MSSAATPDPSHCEFPVSTTRRPVLFSLAVRVGALASTDEVLNGSAAKILY